MEGFVQSQGRNTSLEKRFDYFAFVPAAAAICYPFILNAFHAVVGTQAVTATLAIVGATLILAAAFAVPSIGLAPRAGPILTQVQGGLLMPAWYRRRSMFFLALSKPWCVVRFLMKSPGA